MRMRVSRGAAFGEASTDAKAGRSNDVLAAAILEATD